MTLLAQCDLKGLRVNSLDECEGKEIAPGIWLIGKPEWNIQHHQWRCLVDVNGKLCLIELKVTQGDEHVIGPM